MPKSFLDSSSTEKMSETVVDFINHYKKSIEKHSEDRERILHCLTRLAKLKVNVQHLQLTGIGKTVACVRKLEGEVGDLAKKLVIKWKDMVADAEKAEKMKPPVPLFKLPIKLEPEDIEPGFELIDEVHLHLNKSSLSEGTESSRNKHQHHHSSRNSKSSKEDKKPRSSDSTKSTDSKHHKSHHSRSSHGDHSSSKRKHEELSNESKENEATQKTPKLEKEDIKKEASSSTSKSDSGRSSNQHSKTTSSKSKESSSSLSSKSKEEKPLKRKVSSEAPDEEMDGSQGMGFAEALALFDMPATSKKKDLQLADKITKVKTSSTSKPSRSDVKSSSSSSEETKKSLKSLTAPPQLLIKKPKLEPLPDIVNDLPSDVSIPDYRPMPLSSAVKDYINSHVHNTPYNNRPPQIQKTDTEILTESFSSKANRTKVYSGNRTQKSVPSLFEMCIRVLQENIDFIETTGGVPFEILRPVLERAKPDQLRLIEYYNPYLLDESDILWEPHCKRKFRSRKRLEMETWRDLYDRCTTEDEEKLNRLTQNIKQHQETSSNGVQKTMLAFVDSMVKPPRNIMRKQEIYGTNKKLVVSPAARTVGLKHMAPNLAAAGDIRLRIAAGIRDDAQNVVGRGIRPGVKKAPMMAKILSKFKR